MADYHIPTLADTLAATPQLFEHGDSSHRAADDEVLWRYMPLWKFDAMLRDRALYFNKLTNFVETDPLEGAIPAKQIIADAMLADDAAAYHKFIEAGPISQTYINCWHRGEVESPEMWEAYASLSEGVIVVSTVGQLRAQFTGSDGLKIGVVEPVRYIDFEKDTVATRDPFATIAIKSGKDFRHEREMRVWFVYHIYDIKAILPCFELVSVNLAGVVSKIILAPQSSDVFAKRVRELLVSAELQHVPMLRSRLS